MKRCSQCEFTFEDHQQFCDFDSTELTVVPEPVPSFKNFSVPPAVAPSLFLRVARSRVSLAILALAGLMLSALVIGYYDAESQSNIEPNIDLASNAESRNDMVNRVPQDQSETLEQAKPDQVAKPRFISTQRKIRADEESSSMPSSMIRSPSAASRTRAQVLLATSKPEGNKRRFEKPDRESLARNQKAGSQKANRESLPRNQKRPVGRQSGSARQKSDSKVVAILKKTGSILTRPFKF